MDYKPTPAAELLLRLAEGDSNQLLGSPVATRLADNRAFYRHESWSLGQMEKFKPYAVPEAAVVEALMARIRGKIG